MQSLATDSEGPYNTWEEMFCILAARCQASLMKPEKADSPAMAACIPSDCLKTGIDKRMQIMAEVEFYLGAPTTSVMPILLTTVNAWSVAHPL